MEKRDINIWNWIDRFRGDRVILMVALLLLLTSVISVFSSTPQLVSKSVDRTGIMMDQLRWVGVAVTVIALLYVFGDSKWYRIVAPLGFWGSLVLLLFVVLKLKIGPFSSGNINGAQRVITYKDHTQIHVYELVKVGMVFYLAWALDTFKKGGFTFTKKVAARYPRLKVLATPFGEKAFYLYAPILLVTVLIMTGSNSSALFMGGLMVIIILVGGVNYRDVGFMALALVAGVGLMYGAHVVGIMKEDRVGTLIGRLTQNVEKDLQVMETSPRNSYAYQAAKDKVKQTVGAQLAIKEGGLLGKGIGNSTQKYAVPLIFGDYMFSFIIEETGLAGALFMMLLYFSLLARGTLIAKDCDDYFDKMMVVGLTLLITGQAFMHMAVNVHVPLVPQTGQTLPLVSHGTSALLVFSAAFGVLLSISRHTWKKMKEREAQVEPILPEHDDMQQDLSQLETMDFTEEE